MIGCNEWKPETATNAQIWVEQNDSNYDGVVHTSFPERDLRNFRPLGFPRTVCIQPTPALTAIADGLKCFSVLDYGLQLPECDSSAA